MWVFDEQGGFYSAVTHEKYPNLMWVRTRDQQTAERLSDWKHAAGHENAEILEWKNRDYAYRVEFTRDQWIAYMTELMQKSKATNFKSEVAGNIGYKPGRNFLRSLGSIWQIMYDYQQDSKSKS